MCLISSSWVYKKIRRGLRVIICGAQIDVSGVTTDDLPRDQDQLLKADAYHQGILRKDPSTPNQIVQMSRGSIRTFLLSAKRHLHQTLKSKDDISFVIGNESADLDSITSALLYGYIKSNQVQAKRSGKVFIPITNIPAADLSLRPELTVLLQHAGIKPSELITLDDLDLQGFSGDKTDWTLVDHNVLQGPLGQRFSSRVSGVIDHHEDESRVPISANPRMIEKTGSCTSLIVNHCRIDWESFSSFSTSVGAAHGQDDRLLDDTAYTTTWDAQAAMLALGSILTDTANMKDEHKVTDHDRRAVRFLEALINTSPKLGTTYDREKFYSEIESAKADLDGLSLHDVLRKDYKQWTEGEITLGVAAVVRSLRYLRDKGDDFDATLVRFAKERSLPLFAVMTAHTDEGEFQRELMLVALAEGDAKDAAERFVANSKGELQLSENERHEKPSGVTFSHTWDQKNLAASRKQVAPLLRQAMRGSKIAAKC